MIDLVLLQFSYQSLLKLSRLLVIIRPRLNFFLERPQGRSHIHVAFRYLGKERITPVKKALLFRTEPGEVVGDFRRDIETVAVAHASGKSQLAHFGGRLVQAWIDLQLPGHMMSAPRVIMLGVQHSRPGKYHEEEARDQGHQPAANGNRLPRVFN